MRLFSPRARIQFPLARQPRWSSPLRLRPRQLGPPSSSRRSLPATVVPPLPPLWVLSMSGSMAASSPASSGKAATASDSSAPSPAPAVANGSSTPQKLPPAAAFDMPKPSLRGLNKPKCIQCGNVARSRCPFQCCKSCCYKAQNPCHIHVLKQNSTLPDKPPPTSTSLSEQPLTNSPSTGSMSRLAILQKLPHHFLNTLRTKKSLAKKDVVNINKWRFMKLKEHMQGDIDVENEAFERYTQNIGLLEESFSVSEDAVEPEAETTSEERMDVLVSEARVRLKSDHAYVDSLKESIATILDQKLKKLREKESSYEDANPSNQNLDDHMKPAKLTIKKQMESTARMNELLAKLTRAQSKDDLKPCIDILAQLCGNESLPISQDFTTAVAPLYSFPNLWTRVGFDADMLFNINGEFPSTQMMQL